MTRTVAHLIVGWALGLRGVSQCELVMAARLTEHRVTADVAREPVGVMGFMAIPRSRRRSSGTANAGNRIEFRFRAPLLYSIRCSTCRVRRLSRRHSCRPDARTCEDQTSEISYVFTGISILAVPVGTSYTPNVFRVGRISNQRWIADHGGVFPRGTCHLPISRLSVKNFSGANPPGGCRWSQRGSPGVCRT